MADNCRGWESSETPELFVSYAEVVVRALGDWVLGTAGEIPGAICTLNEVNTGALNNRAAIDDILERVGRFQVSDDELFSLTDEMLRARRAEPWVAEAAAELGTTSERFTPWTFATSRRAFQTIMQSHRLAVAAVKGLCPALLVGFAFLTTSLCWGLFNGRLWTTMSGSMDTARYLGLFTWIVKPWHGVPSPRLTR